MRWLARIALTMAVLTLGVAALVAAALRPPPPLQPPPPGAHFARVTLVEPGGGRRADVSLHIEGDRVAVIGPPEADDELAGAYVLPGLTDMHVHFPAFPLPGERELDALLLVAHGVTTARVMGDVRPGGSDAIRGAIEGGDAVGPRLLSCGAFVDGEPPLWPNSKVVRSADEARAAVEDLAEAGADCIKAYDGLDLESTTALRDAAEMRGLPVVGHTPRRVPFEEGLLEDVQHLRGVHPPLAGERERYPFFLAAWRRADDAWLERVVEVSLHHGVAHTPTLVTVDTLLRARDWPTLRADPAFALVPPTYPEVFWHPQRGLNAARLMQPEDFDMLADAVAAMKRTVGRLHAAGVAIHTGSDANAPMIVPGARLHRELQLLVEAGLSPEEALAASTRRAPAFLGVPGLGSLREGAPAELALFREDPTRDLAALSSLVAVVRGGRLLPRAALDAQLARYREHYDSAFFRRIATPAARRLVDVLLARLGQSPAASE
jgi:imidazolonepropionase-like amidohydrolase